MAIDLCGGLSEEEARARSGRVAEQQLRDPVFRAEIERRIAELDAGHRGEEITEAKLRRLVERHRG